MMSLALIVLGVLLIGWGGVLLLTGEFVATLDIAAGLVSSGVVVIALAAIVRALDRLGERFPARDEEDEEEEVELELPPLDIATGPVFPVSPVPAAVAAEPALQELAVEAPEVAMPTAEPAAVPDVAPAPATPSAAAAPAATVVEPPGGPSLIREGRIDGRMYRFFDDGSIEAEGPEGVRRFKSMDEAREAILQERRPASPEEVTSEEPGTAEPQPDTAPADVKPASEAKPDAPARQPIFQTPIREEPVEAKPVASAPSAPPASKRSAEDRKQRKPVTWESYLAAGRIQESGEKSEAKDSAPSDEEGKAEAAPTDAKPDEPTAAEPPSGAWAEPFRALLQDDKKKDKKEKPDES